MIPVKVVIFVSYHKTYIAPVKVVIFTFLFSFANILVGNYIEKKLNKMNHQEQIDYLLSKTDERKPYPKSILK